MPELVISGATIIPMTGPAELIEQGYVTVDRGAIATIGSGDPPGEARGRRIEAAGKVLLPGLVNAHTHLYQTMLRGAWDKHPLLLWLRHIYGAADALQPQSFFTGTLLGCLEAIKGGVTTVCEHNFLNPHPACSTETVRALVESGLRTVFARTIMDTGDIVPDSTKESPQAAFHRIEDLVTEARSTALGNGRLSFLTGPNTPPLNVSPALLAELRAFADSLGIGISTHVAEAASIREQVQAGLGYDGVVAYLDKFGLTGHDSVFAHAVHITADEIETLARTSTSVSHNPVSNMMLGDGVAPVAAMLRAGVNVALGTDGAASNHTQDLFETIKAASLLQRLDQGDPSVIDPYGVLHMATAGGARALGLQAVCGTIEPGKRADLTLLDIDVPHIQPVNNLYSQLVHCAKASDVRTVIVDGQVLMEERQVLTLDEEKVLANARSEREALRARLDSVGV